MAKRMKLRVSPRLLKKKTRRSDARTARSCRFSSGEVPVAAIDYKNASFLRAFLTERGKIVSSRTSGNAARYQRLVACEIKKARMMGLLPYLALEKRAPIERDRGERENKERGNERRSGENRYASSFNG